MRSDCVAICEVPLKQYPYLMDDMAESNLLERARPRGISGEA